VAGRIERGRGPECDGPLSGGGGSSAGAAHESRGQERKEGEEVLIVGFGFT